MDLQEALAALAAAKQELEAKGATITSLTAANTKISADLLEANTKLAAVATSLKASIVEKHLKAGRFFPAQRADVELLAEKLSAEELDERLAKWAPVTRPTPTGSPTAAPPEADVIPLATGDKNAAHKVLEAKAKELQAATPGLSFADAYVQAARSNPKVAAQHIAVNTRSKKGA